MKKIEDLESQKKKLQDIEEEFDKKVDILESKITKKFIAFNVTCQYMSDIATMITFFVSGGISFFMTLFIIIGLDKYLPEKVSEIVFFSIFGGIFLIAFGILAYLGWKEQNENNKIRDEHNPEIDKIRNEFHKCKKIYREDLLMLDLAKYSKMSLNDVQKLNATQRLVIQDLRNMLKDNGFHDIVKAINEKNKINRLTKPVLITT